MYSRFLAGGLAASAVALVVVGCGGGDSSMPPAPTPSPTNATPSTATVTIVGSSGSQAFSPDPVMVASGGTVTFKNNDSTVHHIVLDDGSGADLGNIAPGASQTVTLKGSGGNYHCMLHASMVGSINGSAAPTPAPCNPYMYGGC
jgi:plastocyanin